MPQSFASCQYHIVFSTKGRAQMIKSPIRERLYAYINGILADLDGQVIAAGGTEDHVHLLIRLHPSRALSDVIRTVKACSSKWIHETFSEYRAFKWQAGYGAFTVSFSALESVRTYVECQEEHHRTMSFDEEVARLCERHEIPMYARLRD